MTTRSPCDVTPSDDTARMQHVAINIVPGKVAPRYNEDSGIVAELVLKHVTITEQGTQQDLPMLDLVLVGDDGKRYLVVTTGRIACSIAAAVRGVNLRNHGIAEP